MNVTSTFTQPSPNVFNMLNQINDLRLAERTLLLTYQDAPGRKSAREVLPLESYSTFAGDWVLLAFCFKRNQVRAFRFDRILSWDEGNDYNSVEDYPLLAMAMQFINYAAQHDLKLGLQHVTSTTEAPFGNVGITFELPNGLKYTGFGYGHSKFSGRAEEVVFSF